MTFDDLVEAVAPTRAEVVSHPIYYALHDTLRLRTFMEHHVWAVWDFMSLLTALQLRVTCTSVPWLPPRSTHAARFVNEIKTGEECDAYGEGYIGHVDLYRLAMGEAGASTIPIDATMRHLVAPGQAWHLYAIPRIARGFGAPSGAERFLTTTFGIIEVADLPALAAAFTLGREQLIPAMFEPLLAGLGNGGATLRHYLDRHIELDGETHGPLARSLVEEVCRTEADWTSARRAAIAAVMARRQLWTDTLDAMVKGT